MSLQPWTPHLLAQLDEKYDRERVVDPSRYGAHLERHQDMLRGFDGEAFSPVEFAAGAWRVATAPIMEPGYVRIRPDLAGITAAPAEDDRDLLVLTVSVRLTIGQLANGALLRCGGWQDWRPVVGYRGEAHRPLEEPADHCRAVLTVAQIRVPVYARDVPVPGSFGRTGQLRDAQAAVAALARIVNAAAGPAVADLTTRAGARL